MADTQYAVSIFIPIFRFLTCVSSCSPHFTFETSAYTYITLYNMSDLQEFLATPVMEALDPDRVAVVLSAHPFVTVPGVANLRDIGGVPVSTADPDGKRLVVRKGRMYRAASMSRITPEGKEALRALNVGAAFDLRTLYEVRKYAKISPDNQDPRAGLVDLASQGDGEADIKVVHNPLINLSTMDPKAEFAVLLKYANGDQGYVEGYTEILEQGSNSYGAMLRYILDEAKGDEKACLWYCHSE